MSLWAWRTWTHYQLISLDWVYWFLSTAYSICAYPFENGIHFLLTNASLVDHFRCPTPNIRTDQSVWSEALHTKRILGHSFVELRLLNHIGLVSISSSSLDMRWPRHFTFLSCSMMNEVSGTRCFHPRLQQKKPKKKTGLISHISPYV